MNLESSTEPKLKFSNKINFKVSEMILIKPKVNINE